MTWQGPDPASARPLNATFIVLLSGADGGAVPVVNATGAVAGRAADYDGAGKTSARFRSKLSFACPAGQVNAIAVGGHLQSSSWSGCTYALCRVNSRLDHARSTPCMAIMTPARMPVSGLYDASGGGTT